MAVFQNKAMGQRRWFLRLTILTVALALTIGVILMYTLQSSTVVALQSAIESYSSILTGLRLTVIGLIAFCWPRLIQYARHSGRISKDRGTELNSHRWRTIGWLLVIELVLGQNVVGHFLSALDWTAT